MIEQTVHVDQLLDELAKSYRIWGHRMKPQSFHCELQEVESNQFIWFHIKWQEETHQIEIKREEPGDTNQLYRLIEQFIKK